MRNFYRHHDSLGKKQPGFGLLEVLITVVILAIGLLGLAGLQATSLNFNQNAYYRSQATILSYDMVDRIRANRPTAANYLTTFMTPDAAAVKPACLAAGCSAATMAENDLAEWDGALEAILPAGTGSITLAGGTYLLTVSWSETRDNSTTSFQVGFLP
jgi:type IV pilus assembly protein PilV